MLGGLLETNRNEGQVSFHGRGRRQCPFQLRREARQGRRHKAHSQVRFHVFGLHPLDQNLVVDIQGFLKASIGDERSLRAGADGTDVNWTLAENGFEFGSIDKLRSELWAVCCDELRGADAARLIATAWGLGFYRSAGSE
jgi:hypothetical protein